MPSVLAFHQITVLEHLQSIEKLEKKLCNPYNALLYLKTIDDQEVGQIVANHFIPNPDHMEAQTLLFLECSAEVHYGPHYDKKQEIAMHKAGQPIDEVSQLEHFHFFDLAAVLLRDASRQLRSLNLCNFCGLPNVTQQLKLLPHTQENHGNSHIENAKSTSRNSFAQLDACRRSGSYDGERSSREVQSMFM